MFCSYVSVLIWRSSSLKPWGKSPSTELFISPVNLYSELFGVRLSDEAVIALSAVGSV